MLTAKKTMEDGEPVLLWYLMIFMANLMVVFRVLLGKSLH